MSFKNMQGVEDMAKYAEDRSTGTSQCKARNVQYAQEHFEIVPESTHPGGKSWIIWKTASSKTASSSPSSQIWDLNSQDTT